MIKAGLAFFLLAHAQPAPTPEASPAPVVTKKLTSAPELQSYLEPFIYDMKDRRDPFQPYLEVGASTEGDFEGPLLPLQRYDLDEIRLIGIIWDVRDPKAMFMDPNSQIHTLSRDERIGRNNGYIAKIREGEVVVVETIRSKGESVRSPRVIKISR